MEIPVLARMSDFDASIASLTVANPPLISRLLSIFELGRWKWGALLLAFIYAFSSVVHRIKLLFFHRHIQITSKLSFSSDPLFSASDDENDDVAEAEDDRNDDVSSSCSSDDDRDENENENENLGGFYEDFRVAGSANSKFKICRRRSLTGDAFSSLAELVSGNGIVKLWDGLGLGFDLADSISILDLDRNVTIGSIAAPIPAVSVSVSPSSPRVIFTASSGGDGSVGLSSWDMRLRRRSPAMEAEWRMGAVAGLNAGGVDKVYVRDDVSGNMTVGDMRKPRSPLVNVTEYDGERWF